MTKRGVRRYVDDLLAGRRPRPFLPDAFEATQMRTAIDLQAARKDADQPRPEFVDTLKERIAAQMSRKRATPQAISPTRRQVVVVGTTAAATAAVAAFSVDRLLIADSDRTGADTAEQDTELVPNHGSWRHVANSTELPDGGVRSFDLGSVNGFIRRAGGQVQAVSGVCTHQGCRLWFDQSADRLLCPCHTTSFSPAGQVLSHQLPIAPKPLPHFDVRESAGVIEVLAPPAEPA
jgi:cytochrome b6-f complex iron-sulfur subunit